MTRSPRLLPDLRAPARAPLLQVLKTSAAAVAAWLLASWALDVPMPIFAAIAALLVVQPSVNQTVLKGVERSLGVVGGVVIAWLAGLLLGQGAWVVLLVIVAALLVAHSKGGLVGKHILVVDDAAAGGDRVDRLIAIATPFAGARLARFVPSRTIQALGPTAEAIELLRANREADERITSIFGDYDPHIPEGSLLPGATNVEVPVVGHFRLLRDRRVIAAVVAAA